MFPYFLPDGSHFLYSVISRGPGEAVLRVGSLQSREFKFLLNADPGAAYAPPHAGRPGSLVFAYYGALMSQEFDAERRRLKGTASRIARQVRHVAARTDFSISADGVLAYQADSEADRYLTWFDRNGRGLRSIGAPNNYTSISLSPDESRLAMEAKGSASGRAEIWMIELRRGSLSRITAQATEGFSPIWSPDGRDLVFSSETPSGMSLMRQTLDETSASPLLELEGVKIATDWSSNGKFIAYSSPWPDLKKLSVWAVPTRGSEKNRGRSYTSGGHNECCAAFSPAQFKEGSRWMAYSSDETGLEEIYVKSFPAGDRKWQVSSGGGWLAHWRQDGRELFYLAPDSKLMAVHIAGGPNFASSSPQPLFETRIVRFNYPELPGNS